MTPFARFGGLADRVAVASSVARTRREDAARRAAHGGLPRDLAGRVEAAAARLEAVAARLEKAR